MLIYLLYGMKAGIFGIRYGEVEFAGSSSCLLSQLKVNMMAGRIRCSSKGVSLTRGEEHASTRDGERSVYQYLSSAEGLGGFQDNFDW